MDALPNDGDYQHSDAEHTLGEAVEAFIELSDVWWHGPFLTVSALRSFATARTEIVRLPLCLSSQDTDYLLLRVLAEALFETPTIYVPAVSTSGLADLFVQTQTTLLMDLTAAGEGIAPFIRRGAHARSIPGNSVATKEDKEVKPNPIYGETVLIVPSLLTSYIGPTSVAVPLAKYVATPGIDTACIMALKPRMRAFAQTLSVSVERTELPGAPGMGSPLAHGFLTLFAIAHQMDAVYPNGSFVNAVQAAWGETKSRLAMEGSPRTRRAQLCALIRDYVDPELNPAARAGTLGEWRLDHLALHVRMSDPELFNGFDPVALGKELFWLGIGTKGRKSYPSHEGRPRVSCTYVVFSDVDRARLNAEALYGI